MTLYAFDAAFPPAGSIGSALSAGLVYKANGGVAANVYVSGSFAQDANHVHGLRADGIGPWPNYETMLWELVSNRAAGQAAARRGITDAIRCGFPADGTIWFPFSVDVSVDPSQYGRVADAFRGIQDVNAGRYRISCYGQGGLIKYLRAQGVIREKGWLSASSSFPGYDRYSPDVCVWQETGNWIPGHSTDRNVITDPHALGAWWPTGSPYNPTEPPPPAPNPQEEDMATIFINQDAPALRLLDTGSCVILLHNNASGGGAPVVKLAANDYLDLRRRAVN